MCASHQHVCSREPLQCVLSHCCVGDGQPLWAPQARFYRAMKATNELGASLDIQGQQPLVPASWIRVLIIPRETFYCSDAVCSLVTDPRHRVSLRVSGSARCVARRSDTRNQTTKVPPIATLCLLILCADLWCVWIIFFYSGGIPTRTRLQVKGGTRYTCCQRTRKELKHLGPFNRETHGLFDTGIGAIDSFFNN